MAIATATLQPSEAAQILIDRKQARNSFASFCRHVKRDYIDGYHLKSLCTALERVEAGEMRRLMVFMPPRHSKSMHVSELFPCWALGRNPELEIVQCGHTHGLTVDHSRHARDFFVSDEMVELFPSVHHTPHTMGLAGIAVQRQAAHEWGTTSGGKYYAVGVQGSLTGRGADIAIIDDPVKDREEAESETIRAKVWDWYKSTLYTRLSPTGSVIVVMTRWHPGDLAGKLLAEAAKGTGDQWHVIKMPAIDGNGNPLWPERWPLEKLQEIKQAVGSHEWAALYQQEPVLRGGNMFVMDKVRVHETAGEFPDTRYVRFWDLASTAKERAKDDPDYTAGALVGVTLDGPVPHLWIKDIQLCQHEAPARNERILAATESDGAGVQIGVESVAGYKDTHATLRDILLGQRTVTRVTVSGDKVVRAAPLEPIFEAGHVHILRGPWNEFATNQFREFPRGAHDDIVDAVSGAYRMLTENHTEAVSRRLIGA